MKLLVFILCLFFATPALAGPAALAIDDYGIRIQGFVPDPAKSQVNTAMTGTVVFKKGTGGTVDITGWLAIQINPTIDSYYYFNTDTTKTYPLAGGVDSVIFVPTSASTTQIAVVLGAGTASVQGM